MPSKKHDLPAMPMYWGDWFKAMDVQSLPRETRCVWFEMIGRMWEGNERGYLTMNGKPMSDFALAFALGFGDNVESYKRHERVLEEAGIFSRRESDGAIYCRRTLQLIDLSEKRKQAGSKGGSKTQANGQASGAASPEDEIENENVIENRIKKFKEELNEYVEQYSAQTVQVFFEYWSELNPSKTKMRKELEKTWETKRRLNTWKRNEEFYGKSKDFAGDGEKSSALAAFEEAVRVRGQFSQAGPKYPKVSDPIIDRVVSVMGGWLNFQRLSDKDISFRKKEFIENYLAIQEKDKKE